jgi:hypothetical protein
MNAIVKVAILSLVTATTMFAESSRQVGTWSVYTSSGNLTRNHMVILRTEAVGQERDARGNSVAAKLDIVCKNDKVVAVALETPSKIDKHTVSYSQAVPTTKVGFLVEGRIALSENWAVSDGGRTLSPYSELFQGKLNRTWVERISGTDKVVLQLNQNEGDELLAPTFNTAQLSDALSAVGCTK